MKILQGDHRGFPFASPAEPRAGWPGLFESPRSGTGLVPLLEEFGSHTMRASRTMTRMTAAMMPAPASSAMIPHPAGNRSRLLMGYGFKISRARNRMNPSKIEGQVGANNSGVNAII